MDPNAFDEQLVPNWLPEVLAWIKRIELAQSSLSTSNRLFHRLCLPKLHGPSVPRRMVPRLTIWPKQDDESKIEMLREKKFKMYPPQEFEAIPIADCPPPDYILGFKSIHFALLDARALRFVAHVIANRDYRLVFMYKTEFGDKIARMLLFPLILDSCVYVNLPEFHRLMPAMVSGAQAIGLESNGSDTDLLIQWLEMERHPVGRRDLKQLHVKFDSVEKQRQFVERIRERFAASTRPLPFWISLHFDARAEGKLPVRNEETGEMLVALYLDNDDSTYQYCLVRCAEEDFNNEQTEKGHLMGKFLADGPPPLQSEIIVDIQKIGRLEEFGGEGFFRSIGSGIKKFGSNVAQRSVHLMSIVFSPFARLLPANFHSTA